MKQDNQQAPDQSTRAGFSRRQVLGGSSALAAAAVFGGRAKAAPSAFFGPNSSTPRDVYVNIFLRGAMDGLTTVVPYGDLDLYAARPTLAIAAPGQPDGAIDLDGFFGLAPSAAPLMTPYSNGHLAFVHAAGSTDPTRSHFDAFARMELGDPALPPGTVTDGWMARYLNQLTARATGPLRAVQADSFLPIALTSAPNALPIPDFGNFAFPGNGATAQNRVDKLTVQYSDEPAPVGSSAISTFDSIGLMNGIDFAGYIPSGGAVYPNTILGDRMRNTAALIKASVGVEVINIDYGNWDLHANLGPINGVMAAMLDELSSALEAFYLDMGAGIDDVTVVCTTEFARRVEENSSAGTDHGHGGVMIAMGGHINGGQVISNWPGLAPGNLDNGDLAVTIDYRDILGEILVNRLAATDVTQIFPMHVFTSHGITV